MAGTKKQAAPFALIPAAVIEALPTLTPAKVKALVTLATFMDRAGSCFPSIEAMMLRGGYTPGARRRLERTLAQLGKGERVKGEWVKGAELIVVERRGGRRSNVYRWATPGTEHEATSDPATTAVSEQPPDPATTAGTESPRPGQNEHPDPAKTNTLTRPKPQDDPATTAGCTPLSLPRNTPIDHSQGTCSSDVAPSPDSEPNPRSELDSNATEPAEENGNGLAAILSATDWRDPEDLLRSAEKIDRQVLADYSDVAEDQRLRAPDFWQRLIEDGVSRGAISDALHALTRHLLTNRTRKPRDFFMAWLVEHPRRADGGDDVPF